MNVAWIEHHGTRIVSLAGLVGGAAAVFVPGDILSGVSNEAGVALAIGAAALHLANRALSAFRQSAGLEVAESEITPRQ